MPSGEHRRHPVGGALGAAARVPAVGDEHDAGDRRGRDSDRAPPSAPRRDRSAVAVAESCGGWTGGQALRRTPAPRRRSGRRAPAGSDRRPAAARARSGGRRRLHPRCSCSSTCRRGSGRRPRWCRQSDVDRDRPQQEDDERDQGDEAKRGEDDALSGRQRPAAVGQPRDDGGRRDHERQGPPGKQGSRRTREPTSSWPATRSSGRSAVR